MAENLRSVELFTGAGGLALGVSRAGFKHLAVIELDKDSCETLAENNKRRVEDIPNWPIFNCDVRAFDYGSLCEDIELLAAGVPCQPFSIGGRHKGHRDERNMFPDLLNAIRRLKPKAILVENVRGLVRRSFSKYFGYIELILTHPEISRKPNEEWHEHLVRLERHHRRGSISGLQYKVIHRVLNSADYGVPQKRERLFIVGLRSDLKAEWNFPCPTHGVDALLWQQHCTGEYWERHTVPIRKRPKLSAQLSQHVRRLQNRLFPPPLKAWRTVRDALFGLPHPFPKREASEPAMTHFLIPGARTYVGHTGSPLDEPAKTLKAGVHGVPGGENMLAMQDGSVRYFTIRESARLQTFPDEFVFPGSWTESMRQIGNAVPVEMAELISRKLVSVLYPKNGTR